ncbi:uncharacterized protein Dwil_GK18980 [Drosophila willistoni]|uniref:Uncharacterized protein n=1 Tax=Drosophila willistoni TaxID=7260 RepID=B4NHT2_DROWI|nr:uncharacterized protein LOC6650927 [Drosophila willistoni]EDW84692.1 uncharacterized protein Dwil_GK18980 [Drosophila willistoni]
MSAMTVSLAALDTGYAYENPVGDQLIEPTVHQVHRPLKHRLKPSINYCNNELGSGETTERYRAAHPPPRRFIHHREVVVNRDFFEPSAERVEELKRILLEQ